MSIPSLHIGTATRAELDLMVEWAAGEGWNPGLADADCFHAADPAGFLVGRLDGEPVGCISVVTYEPAFAFLGFYIVKPEHRGQGYGLRLWQAGMARLENRVVGLDGVIAQQDNYKKIGILCSPTATSASAARRVASIRATAGSLPSTPAWSTPSWPMTARSFLPRATRSCGAGCGLSSAKDWR